MAQEYAGRLALVGFMTSAIQGVMSSAAFEPALKFSLAAAAVCYGLGWLCGELARRAVEEAVIAEFAPPAAAAAPLPAAATAAPTGR